MGHPIAQAVAVGVNPGVELGELYGDARGRAMPAILSTLMQVFVAIPTRLGYI